MPSTPDPYKFGEAYFDPETAVHYGQKHLSFGRRLSHSREASLIARLLGSGTGWVLDAPCGSGRFAPTLHRLGYKVVACDRAAPMTSQAADTGCDAAVTGTLASLPFRDASIDAMICIRFLHHLPNRAERVACLREMARVVRGVIVLSAWIDSPVVRWRRYRRARSSTRYLVTREELERDLAEAGLQSVRSLRLVPGWSALVYFQLESIARKNS